MITNNPLYDDLMKSHMERNQSNGHFMATLSAVLNLCCHKVKS